jgi:hypothetical protein
MPPSGAGRRAAFFARLLLSLALLLALLVMR